MIVARTDSFRTNGLDEALRRVCLAVLPYWLLAHTHPRVHARINRAHKRTCAQHAHSHEHAHPPVPWLVCVRARVIAPVDAMHAQGTYPRTCSCGQVRAFADVGADVVFIDGLKSKADVTALAKLGRELRVHTMVAAPRCGQAAPVQAVGQAAALAGSLAWMRARMLRASWLRLEAIVK